jgi:hypothetical protein
VVKLLLTPSSTSLMLLLVLAEMLVYGYSAGFPSVTGTQAVESYHRRLKAQFLAGILGSVRRLDWLMWTLLNKVGLAFMMTLVDKAGGEMHVARTLWPCCGLVADGLC